MNARVIGTRDDQLLIENLMVEMAQAGFDAKRDKAIKKGATSELRPEQTLLVQNTLKVATAIEVFKATRTGRLAAVASAMDVLEPEVLAYLSLKACLNGAARASTTTNVQADIFTYVQDEVSFRELAKQAPELYRVMVRNAKESGRTGEAYTHKVFNAGINKAGISFTKLEKNEKHRLALKLLEIVIASTGLFEWRNVRNHKGRANNNRTYLVGTPALQDWLDGASNKMGTIYPNYMPTVVPPIAWTTLSDGGFITRRLPFVKTRDKGHKDLLATADLSLVMEAVNTMQDTAWQVNTFVLDVFRTLWESGSTLAGLVSRDPVEVPEKPMDIATNPEAKQSWKILASSVHEKNRLAISHRVSTSNLLSLAERFSKYESIYFPYNLDSRGRAYPAVTGLSPQGTDLGKALLRFTTGEALGSEGWKWLAIHIANCYGYNKCSMSERIQWTLDNSLAICDSGINPLDGNRFWAEADDPFLFLAAANEWVQYIAQGDTFVSHINIQLDGAANGLQNLSAMLRDEVGGKATCLVPQDKPSDIYKLVAERAEKIIAKEIEANVDSVVRKGYTSKTGVETPDVMRLPMARLWSGKITRDLTKGATMTKPYGSTVFGIKMALEKKIGKLVKDGKLDSIGVSMETSGESLVQTKERKDLISSHAAYLAGILNDAVEETVIAAKVVMGWLQDTAKIMSSAGVPIDWVTPMGLPVRQHYKEQLGKRVDVTFMGVPQKIMLRHDGDKINSKKQVTGVSPNFVHSLDAAHMQRTVLMCKDNGLTNVAFIHDSYGTTAGSTGIMAAALRESFIEQYQDNDVLEQFYNSCKESLKDFPEYLEKLTPVPTKGTLDLDQIRDSQYFFA